MAYVRAEKRLPQNIPRDENGIPKIPEHTGIHRMHLQATGSIDSAGLREGVKCPKHFDQTMRDEWVATQVWHAFQEVDYTYCMLRQFCNKRTCPRMSAGSHVHYTWHDEVKNVTEELCAIDYMYNTVTWGFEKLTDPSLVPRDGGKTKIPHARFYDEARTIMRRFFRIYAHAYIHHYPEINAVKGDVESCLNFCFKHFIFIAKEFDLVEPADMAPLKDLITQFERQADERVNRERVLKKISL